MRQLFLVASLFFSTCLVSASSFEKAYNSMNKAQFKKHVQTLSSDAFGGRAPASEGEKKTLDYMIGAFKELGLKPGNKGSFTQEVPLVSITTTPVKHLTIGKETFAYGKDYVVTSSHLKDSMTLKDSELVFVGYGIVAPEFQWNDYAGIDMKGKTAVILVNDPGYATGDDKLFTGKAMTYYGRWTYKYEEAARQGAAGAIIIHETAPASYGWQVVETGWSGPQFHLPAKKADNNAVDLEMWITQPKAAAILSHAGQSFDKLKQQAKKPGFKPVSLGLKASATVKNEMAHSKSYNIMATIPGSKRPQEHIIYTAHWDHLGIAEDKSGDNIYNGALDNATGTSALLMIAQAFKTLPQAPERSITFIAVAAEEQGLLGSKYYAANPTYPLNKTVGIINMDSLDVSGLKKDMTVVGFNKSELQNFLAKAALSQNRTLKPESKPERGGFYRSDHFSLAKKGVPALYAGGGTVPLNDKEAAIAKKVAELKSRCYHQPCDEYSDLWSLDSAIADMQVFFETGYLLAKSEDWPNWYQGTEFKQIREKSLKQ